MPDATAPPIVFGTDGWRARIAEEYTYEHVRRCAQGVAEWVTRSRDGGAGASSSATTGASRASTSPQAAAEVLLAHDIPVAFASSADPDADDLVRGRGARRRVRRR